MQLLEEKYNKNTNVITQFEDDIEELMFDDKSVLLHSQEINRAKQLLVCDELKLRKKNYISW